MPRDIRQTRQRIRQHGAFPPPRGNRHTPPRSSNRSLAQLVGCPRLSIPDGSRAPWFEKSPVRRGSRTEKRSRPFVSPSACRSRHSYALLSCTGGSRNSESWFVTAPCGVCRSFGVVGFPVGLSINYKNHKKNLLHANICINITNGTRIALCVTAVPCAASSASCVGALLCQLELGCPVLIRPARRARLEQESLISSLTASSI